MSTKTTHFLSADRPIELLKDDRLQRRGFATSIAQAITTWHGDDSLVMALYGGWGDGKSSVKGMVTDVMKKDPKTCPFIVQFNPWEWAGQNQLAQVFFDEIGKQIAHQGRGQEKRKAEECGQRLRKLGKYLNLTGTFMTPLGYAANLAFPFTSLVTDAAAKALKKSSELAKQAGEAVQERKEREASDLLTVKSELKGALTALNRNVVVMVDDIDRLAADEIKLLFQLVKANSDFPNLIFFLFFQRDIIEQALEQTVRTGTGKDYLEKIVQVPLSLPEIQRPLLEDYIDSKLRELLERRGLKENFDWPRFREMWQEGLSGYFQNIRDAARFFGTFEFQAAAFPDPSEFNPVDLFALEVLHVFETDVYNTLATSRHLLTPDDLAQFQHDIQNLDVTEPWKKSIKQIVDAGKASRPDAVNAVLQSLFPMEALVLGQRTPEKLGHLLKQARVAHPAFFGRYFHLCIPQGDIPQTELHKLLKAISQPPEFKRLLTQFNKQRLALQALTRLSVYADQFNVKDAEHITVALCDVADALVGNSGDYWWTGYGAMSCLVIEAHIDMLPTSDERFRILKAAFEQTTGVYLPATLVAREASREKEYVRKDEPRGVSRDEGHALTKPQLDELAKLCVKGFERAAASDALKDHSQLKDILDWWYRWSRHSIAAKDYFRKLVATDGGLLILLTQYLGGKLSGDEHQKFVDRLYNRGLNDFEQFMPVAKVKVRVDELAKKQPSAYVAKLCSIFTGLYEEHVRNEAQFPEATPRRPDAAQQDENPPSSPVDKV